ncbi:MAG: SUMF1/EgtB/PvdO family nonheme iron enzyme [Treponema porcinum]|uniref:formylglycine-generating enzyme family protein n=1 Tax=Treponema porcinum TaxID=261392 RepID=UPI002409DF6D|nr:SUMF1/EgtB/PvdO family nonheme iron enzyme [Treponema porcinum]MDD6900011.1 SUMF1/EgtB/PvdO family nonheme iron enzyme [Treponema porcinum]
MKRTTEFIHTLIFIFLALIPAVSCKNELWPVKDSDSDSSVKTVSTANRTITIPDADSTASFVMIDVNIEGGIDEIILGEDLIEVPYRTTVSSFSLARYETSYNTWYEVLKWAEKHGYNIVNKGVEGVFGEVEHEKNMSDAGAEPKLVEMPVCRLTWRDVMVWCNALSEMKGLKPVYCTDKDFKTPLRDSTGVAFDDLKNYATEPGEVDNPYVNTKANGFRLPYVKEWEYAARKRLDGTAISGRNVSGDETGSAIETTATELMNGLSFPLSSKQNEYCWQRQNSASNGPSETYTGQDDTTTTLSTKTEKSISGRRMHLSGGKLPNHLGFFDMSGNVSEWCFDYDVPYGSMNKFSTARGQRGGDYLNEIVGSRCSGNKGGALVGLTSGFRIAQNIPKNN